MDSDSKKRHYLSDLVLIPVCFVILFSFFFIFEAHYISPEDSEGSFEVTADNCYAIQQEDGTYNTYCDGSYLENITSLEYYPEGMFIYYSNGDIRKYREQRWKK